MPTSSTTNLVAQLLSLLLLAIPVSCVSWTVTHEEIFREPRDWCKNKSTNGEGLVTRKFFYLFTCEYCFSHYVTLTFLLITRFHLLYAGWRGYLVGGFALVAVANAYMSVFGRLRLDLKRERVVIAGEERKLEPPG